MALKRLWDNFTNNKVWVDKVRHDIEQAASIDHHRVRAHAEIDARLESGVWSPKKAEQFRKDWDRRHGY